MKTRTGFVSNSSSSSFIISAKKFPTVFSLAKHMISKRGWENDKALIQAMRVAEDQGMSPDTPVSFETVNEETYIVREDDVYLVATCHNIDFELDDACVEPSGERKRELEHKYNIERDCWIDLCFSDMVKDGWFWYPEFNLEGKVTLRRRDIPTYCSIHHVRNIELRDGTICCPECKRKNPNNGERK